MARKQQSAEQQLKAIRERRLALEAKIHEMEARFQRLKKDYDALQDEQVVQQARRKLRYPTT